MTSEDFRRFFRIPEDWRVVGAWSDTNPDSCTEEELQNLGETVVAVIAPNNITLDVGFYPEMTRDGEYVCLVLSGEFDDTRTDEIRTRKPSHVREWLIWHIDWLKGKLGT